MGKFPIIRQLDAMDCGAACLAMVSQYYGVDYTLASMREITFVDRDGVSLLNIKSAAEKIGMETLPVKVNYQRLKAELPLPAIAHWDQNHFVVVYKVTDTEVIIGDPAFGERKLSKAEFEKKWIDKRSNEGVLMLLEYDQEQPNPTIEETEELTQNSNKNQKSIDKVDVPIVAAATATASTATAAKTAGVVTVAKTTGLATRSIFSHLRGNVRFWIHLILGSLLLLLIYLFLPFVIKELIDSGAILKDYSAVHHGLFAFGMLGLGRIVLELSRNWMFQQEAAITNAKLVSNYLEKLTQQPIRFFEKRLKWDILQRIYDNFKVGAFFQSSSVQAVFYLIMLLASSIVLLLLHKTLFLLFFVGLILQLGVILFFRQRRLFAKQTMLETTAKNQDLLFEIINGISAIKLNNAEQFNQSIWEENQATLLEQSLRFNKVDQYQKTAIKLIGWLTELAVLYFALTFLMQDIFTIGSIMAVIYILAYSKNALVDFFDLLIEYQEVQLSFKRLAEVSDMPMQNYKVGAQSHLATFKDIKIENLTFRYGDMDSPIVLDEVNLTIPRGKKTAIVGVSGSGKTTLIKLIVGMYTPKEGAIALGDIDVQDIAPTLLHEKIGVVFEDGHIFSDTIVSNITMMADTPSPVRLGIAKKIACLDTFMEALPLGHNTRIGEDGIQLSKGQKQQVLLARAFYKQPEILFFDEATNALDGITERRLLKNMNEAFDDKTMVFVAHRLSTIKDADQIVVLHKGVIVEQGTHEELLAKKGAYFLILRNDLE